jgi:hypothetical protein
MGGRFLGTPLIDEELEQESKRKHREAMGSRRAIRCRTDII